MNAFTAWSDMTEEFGSVEAVDSKSPITKRDEAIETGPEIENPTLWCHEIDSAEEDIGLAGGVTKDKSETLVMTEQVILDNYL